MTDYEERYEGNGEDVETFGGGSSPQARANSHGGGGGGTDDFGDSKSQMADFQVCLATDLGLLNGGMIVWYLEYLIGNMQVGLRLVLDSRRGAIGSSLAAAARAESGQLLQLILDSEVWSYAGSALVPQP